MTKGDVEGGSKEEEKSPIYCNRAISKCVSTQMLWCQMDTQGPQRRHVVQLSQRRELLLNKFYIILH